MEEHPTRHGISWDQVGVLGPGSLPHTEILTAHLGVSGFDVMKRTAVFPDSSLPASQPPMSWDREWGLALIYLYGSVTTQVGAVT